MSLLSYFDVQSDYRKDRLSTSIFDSRKIVVDALTIRHHDLGSISPNFERQAKRCRRTAFGKKFAVQFHQLNVMGNITSKFAKRRSPNLCAEKSISFCAREKVGRQC